MKEVFKRYKHKGYDTTIEVSNLGRIRTAKGKIHTGSNIKIKHKNGKVYEYGYKLANFSYFIDDERMTTSVALHRAVYLTFIGAIPAGLEVDHIDNNKSNNRVDNLRLLSRKDNLDRRVLKKKDRLSN